MIPEISVIFFFTQSYYFF